MTPQSILLLSDRPGWPERVRSWSPQFDVQQCQSAEEARVLLAGSRPWTVVLIDGSNPAADRDLIALAARVGARPLVVDATRGSIDWRALGAHATLSPTFTRQDLAAAVAGDPASIDGARLHHPLVCVTGPGGTGSSTVAIAISQGLAHLGGSVLLADLCRNAELHVLHHLDSERPWIGDLVEAHRTSAPDPERLRDLPTPVTRGYHVLPGLRRAVGWSSLRPRALEATMHGLRSAYDFVVCDIDADLEGEAEGGSFDVEERNALSRTAVANSSGVVVIGGAGAKGAHSLLRVLGEVWSHGVQPQQTVAVVNRGDPLSLERLGAALDRLGAGETRTLFLPDFPLEPALLADAPLPSALVDPITQAVLTVLDDPSTPLPAVPERVVPGSLGLSRRGRSDG